MNSHRPTATWKPIATGLVGGIALAGYLFATGQVEDPTQAAALAGGTTTIGLGAIFLASGLVHVWIDTKRQPSNKQQP